MTQVASNESGAPQGRRILIVDDNVDGADAMGILLRHSGHDVVLAKDGGHAFRLAETFRPEVALLDIGLPDMDGHDVARRLRQNFGEAIILIAVTGYGGETIRKSCQAAGCNEVFTKPVDFTDLLRCIATARRAPPLG